MAPNRGHKEVRKEEIHSEVSRQTIRRNPPKTHWGVPQTMIKIANAARGSQTFVDSFRVRSCREGMYQDQISVLCDHGHELSNE